MKINLIVWTEKENARRKTKNTLKGKREKLKKKNWGTVTPRSSSTSPDQKSVEPRFQTLER